MEVRLIMYGSYFETIDSHEKAYFLGLIFADAAIKYGAITLEEGSLDILQKLSSAVGCNSPYYIKPVQDRFSTKGQFRVSFQKEKHHLAKIFKMPDRHLPDISPEFRCSFVLGIFDGDGCISLDTRYTKLYPNSVAVPGDFHILFNRRADAETVSDWITDACQINKTKIIEKIGQGAVVIYKLRWGGTNSIIQIRDWLYSKAPVWMQRKREIFLCVKVGDRVAAGKRGAAIAIQNRLRKGPPVEQSSGNNERNEAGKAETLTRTEGQNSNSGQGQRIDSDPT